MPEIIGIGLDNEDGHKRITKGDDFELHGGSHETHERMTEVFLKTKENLARKGRDFRSASIEEVADLMHKHDRE